MKIRNPRSSRGFTLIELLVVIVIIAALASLVFILAQRGILKAQQAKTLQQMRDMGLGVEAFSIDYNRPPIPDTKLNEGVDTIYGDPGGLYGSEVVIGALLGEDKEYQTGTDEIFAARQLNPRGESYISPVIVDDNRGGVGREDGKFYDAWGNEIMFAINTPPFNTDFNDGRKDKTLHTWGLAEWTDKEPRFQHYVLWSYGKDGVKSEAYAGSDDVANF